MKTRGGRILSVAVTTAVALITAIFLSGIDPTSIIFAEAISQKTITLTFHSCSGAQGNHVVNCNVSDTGITNIDCIVPNPEISGGDNLGYCNADNGQKVLCTIPPQPGDVQCQIVKGFTCTSDFQCQVDKGNKKDNVPFALFF